MNGLFVFFYKDLHTEKTGTEYVASNSLEAALEVFTRLHPVSIIIRSTEYIKVRVIDL
jgi:hypothetical protein